MKRKYNKPPNTLIGLIYSILFYEGKNGNAKLRTKEIFIFLTFLLIAYISINYFSPETIDWIIKKIK